MIEKVYFENCEIHLTDMALEFVEAYIYEHHVQGDDNDDGRYDEEYLNRTD